MNLGGKKSNLECGEAWKVEREVMGRFVDQLYDSRSMMGAPASGAPHAKKMGPDAAVPRPHLNGHHMSGVEVLIGEVLLRYGLRKYDYGGRRPSSSR